MSTFTRPTHLPPPVVSRAFFEAMSPLRDLLLRGTALSDRIDRSRASRAAVAAAATEHVRSVADADQLVAGLFGQGTLGVRLVGCAERGERWMLSGKSTHAQVTHSRTLQL